jgi:predicted site-specific integrase-resolvase
VIIGICTVIYIQMTKRKINSFKKFSSGEEELVQDLIAIVTSFSGRVHGLRSRKARLKKKRQEREQPAFQS